MADFETLAEYRQRAPVEMDDDYYTAPDGELTPNADIMRDYRFEVHDDALHGEGVLTLTARSEGHEESVTGRLQDGETMILELDEDKRLRLCVKWYTLFGVAASLDRWDSENERWVEYEHAGWGAKVDESRTCIHWEYDVRLSISELELNDDTLNDVSEDIQSLIETGYFTRRQAFAYALREMHDFKRSRAAQYYPASASDMDNAQREAQNKVEKALSVANVVTE